MRKFTEFTEHDAKNIAAMMGLIFSGYSKSEKEIMIEDSRDVFINGKEKIIYIYSTGEISFFTNDGGLDGRILTKIDQRPIIEYLKKEGFL